MFESFWRLKPWLVAALGVGFRFMAIPSASLSKQKRRLLRLLFGLILVMSSAIAHGAFAAHQGAPDERNTTIQPAQTVAQAKQAGLIPVGMHMELERIYQVSIAEQSFMADGFISMNLPKQIANKIANYGPENKCFTFENSLDVNQHLSILPYSNSADSKIGYEFTGKFAMVDHQQHRRNPFGRLKLEVIVAPTCSLAYSRQKVALVFDPEAKELIGSKVLVENLELPIGYALVDSKLQSRIKQWPGVSYSWLVAAITLSTSAWASFFRWVLPLLVVMAIVIMAPSLGSRYFEARISIPSASLLTLVFLHDAYRSDLPSFPYLTYLDRLYLYSYIVCLVMFILFVLDAFHSWSERPVLNINLPFFVIKTISFEQLVQALCVIGLFLVATVCWYV